MLLYKQKKHISMLKKNPNFFVCKHSGIMDLDDWFFLSQLVFVVQTDAVAPPGAFHSKLTDDSFKICSSLSYDIEGGVLKDNSILFP